MIKAREIKAYPGWADFVFADDYVLPPLAEGEVFTKERIISQGFPSLRKILKKG